MREIIFRGKRKDNGEWVEGTLIFTTSTMEKPYIVDSCWCYNGSVDDEGYAKFEYLNAYEVIPESVSEFTGLTDKNGKKIFEGDIVKTERDLWHGENKKEREVFVSVVRYDEKQCSFGLYGKYKFLALRRFKGDFNEVIGNIHDNPELLKGGENG